MPLFHQYLHKLTHLNRANTRYGKAPHKPVLLITLLELMNTGHLTENKIYADTELVGTFQENWRLLVNTLNLPDFTLPFYHLQSEKINGQPLWHLQPQPGCQINAYIKSVHTLISVLNYGYFSDELFTLLTDSANRNLLLTHLLDAYFPETKMSYTQSKQAGQGYLHDLEQYILNEPEAEYKTMQMETEEDIYVRGGLFKKLVPKIYNHTCCITGMRLQSTFGHSFIDACHIVPFSINHNDTVSNGIALCPNLHRAFDRGLLSINPDYKVEISKHVNEEMVHPYSLTQLNGKYITLPAGRQYYPSPENLEWHRINIFKG